ncbi:MAG: ATP-binding protein [Deltaproteobacteria bacterium]|nr:ATP-binding protein [Candidatus Tharpella aukensis]
MNDQWLYIITEWQNQILNTEGIARNYEPLLINAMGSKPIKIVTGFRRSGKSFLVQRLARHLVEQKEYSLKNILYLNFEDFRLAQINTPEKLNDLYKTFRNQMADSGKKLIVFDEIQKVGNWDKFIRTIYEKDNDIEIILTGSNSELLSAEISSNLAGRFIEFFILPFDLSEILLYQGIVIKSQTDYFRHKDILEKQFYAYVKYGGLPEILTINEGPSRYSYLEGILNKVILDDVIERFKIKHPAIIEKIIYYLFAAIGNHLSFARIDNYLKQLGVNLKPETIINYTDYILKTFALYETTKFDWKIGKVFSTSRKYYAVDTGLAHLNPVTVSNFSKQLENVVFLKLKYNYKNIHFGTLSSGKEIDFIAWNRQGNFTKFQICKTLHDENYQRELSPFSLAEAHLQGDNIILTLDEEEKELNFKGIKVRQLNLVKWLLGC